MGIETMKEVFGLNNAQKEEIGKRIKRDRDIWGLIDYFNHEFTGNYKTAEFFIEELKNIKEEINVLSLNLVVIDNKTGVYKKRDLNVDLLTKRQEQKNTIVDKIVELSKKLGVDSKDLEDRMLNSISQERVAISKDVWDELDQTL